MPRRQFLSRGVFTAGTLALAPLGAAAEEKPGSKVYRAVVIGRTGGGDYGHGYDRIFHGLGNVSVEAVADPDPAGRQRAVDNSGAKRQYADYRKMLETEKPDLVCIAPRQPEGHRDMALAALGAGASLFIEKPLTETVAEADEILAEAEKRHATIVVAHTRRYTREFLLVKALLAEGLIGTVREIHVQGKQDARAGGEDLIVLGTHDFDLLRFYFGDPRWCLASVTNQGRDITAEDVRRGQEPMLVAGDTIHALFAFPKNVLLHWSSVKTDDHWNTNFSKREKWAFEIFGTKGIIAYQSGLGFAWLDSPFLAHKADGSMWKDLPVPARFEMPEHAQQPIRDLIHALETQTQPVCSGADGRWAVEMVAAVYESQVTKGRANFPLARRDNPLRRL